LKKQKGNQTTQWPKEKVQSTIYKTLHRKQDRATRAQLKTERELRCSVRVRGSCSTCGTRRVALVTTRW